MPFATSATSAVASESVSVTHTASTAAASRCCAVVAWDADREGAVSPPLCTASKARASAKGPASVSLIGGGT